MASGTDAQVLLQHAAQKAEALPAVAANMLERKKEQSEIHVHLHGRGMLNSFGLDIVILFLQRQKINHSTFLNSGFIYVTVYIFHNSFIISCY